MNTIKVYMNNKQQRTKDKERIPPFECNIAEFGKVLCLFQ